MTQSADVRCAPRNVVIDLEGGDIKRRIVRVSSFKMSIYARSGRLGRVAPLPVP